MTVWDCVADEAVREGLDDLTAAALCGSLGGNKNGYIVVPDRVTIRREREELDLFAQ